MVGRLDPEEAGCSPGDCLRAVPFLHEIMNPNNNNLDYLLKLPTPRLLGLYRKVRGQVYALDDWDWSDYESCREDLAKLSKDTCYPSRRQTRANKLYWAREIEKLVELETALKKELDTREHVPRAKC